MTALPPSRRAVLGAGAALVAALAAPASMGAAADPDAALLAVCADLLRVTDEVAATDRRISTLPAPDNQALYEVAAAPGGIYQRQSDLRDRMITIPARTAAGCKAKARATASWLAMFHGEALADGSADRGVSLAASLARDILAVRGAV